MESGTIIGLIVGFIVGLIVMNAYLSSITPIIPYPNATNCPACTNQVSYRQASYNLDSSSFTGQGTWAVGGTTINVPVTNKDSIGAVFQITLACSKVRGPDTLTSEKVYIEASIKKTIQIDYPNSKLGGSEDYNCTVSNVNAPIVDGCK